MAKRASTKTPVAVSHPQWSKMLPTSLELATLPVYPLKGLDKKGQPKQYLLKLDTNAIAKVRPLINRDLSVLTSWERMTPEEVVTVVWAAMDAHHPELTLDEVRDMIPVGSIQLLYLILLDLFQPGLAGQMIDATAKRIAQGEKQPNPSQKATAESPSSESQQA